MTENTDWLIYDDMTDEQARELYAEYCRLFSSFPGKTYKLPSYFDIKEFA